MRYIYMAGKTSLGGNPYGVLREPLKKELIEMLLKKPAVIIQNEQETDLDLCEQEEDMRPSLPPEPKLGHLIAVLKKTGISLEQVGDKMGLSFLGNIICQFKLFDHRSCNYVCFLYNYFHKVSHDDWPAKNAILEKLAKKLPKMEQTRTKAEESFNEWWLVANKPPD